VCEKPIAMTAPSEDLREAVEEIRLPNGHCLRIRALETGEEQPIRELLAHLGPRSWRFRFLSPLSTAPDNLVRLLASVDNDRQVALVAEHDAGHATEVVALANLAATGDDGRAELGLVVRDDWQRRRVGSELAMRLMRCAERRGYRRFVIYTLPENAAVRQLLRHVRVVASSFSGGFAKLEFVMRTDGGVDRLLDFTARQKMRASDCAS
jgi:RimJ/RimL family protein N-acetyltransferase